VGKQELLRCLPDALPTASKQLVLWSFLQEPAPEQSAILDSTWIPGSTAHPLADWLVSQQTILQEHHSEDEQIEQ